MGLEGKTEDGVSLVFGGRNSYGDYSLYIASYIDYRRNMLFYYYIILFETAGIEFEVYIALAVGGSCYGASCYFSRFACARYSFVWY